MNNSSSSRQPGAMRSLTSVISLALWRWRQHWFLLLMTATGMIAAVTLVSILPLLTVVLQTAGLRDTLTASPPAAELKLHTQAIGLSSQTLDGINQQINSAFQNLTPYLQGQPRLEIQTPELNIISPEEEQLRTPLRLYGNSIDATASHLVLAQGRLPRSVSPGVIEIALTTATANNLHVQVGSVITVVSNFSTIPARGSSSAALQQSLCSIVPGKADSSPSSPHSYCQRMRLVVVGLFAVKTNDPFWHGEDFQRVAQDTRWHYAAIASNQAVLAALDKSAAPYSANAVYFLEGYYAILQWYYYLDPSRVTLDRLDDLINQLTTTQEGVNQFNSLILSSPNSIAQQFYLESPVLRNTASPGSLESLRSRIAVASVPITILTIQIICLLLFFVIVMIEMLVERQAGTIAMMRSRGASTAQIFGSHFTQGLALCFFALMAGPLLAYAIVVSLAGNILPATSQSALKTISNDPLAAISNMKWYALVMIGVIVLVLAAALLRASRIHALALRRESAHSAARPLWQRLNLDLVTVIIAFTGYGVAVYLTDIGGLLDTRTQAVVSAPIALIAPVFLLLGAVLLFLRFSPLFLRIASRLLARGRSAVPMLSLTQVSRSPRQSVRMIMLLALATAFAIFTLIFSASQAQRAADITAYQAGADFSGSVPFTAPQLPAARETDRYRTIPGVLAASAGFVRADTVGQSSNLFPLQVRAIDPATFTQVAFWNEQNSSQSLNALLAQLVAGRKSAIKQGVIPALVDAYTWNNLGLRVGATFFAHEGTALTYNIRYMAVAEVQFIPTLTNNDLAATQQSGNMIVDYQTFAAIESSQFGFQAPANYVWLRTSDTPAALAHVRSVLQSSDMYLENLNDYRALLKSNQGDPLYLNLIIMLAVGVIAILLLALVGDLLASWLSVRTRLSQFVVLRALGASQRQVVGIMACEQGLVYLIALVAGVGSGILLALTVVPTLALSTLPVAPGVVGSDTFYTIQQIIPAQIVFPWSLGIAFAGLVILCSAAVTIMAWVALRPSLSPMLRLDEEQSPLHVVREETAMSRERPTRAKSQRAGFTYMTLAFGQARRTWFLLVTTGIGIIAAIVMVCSIPLFSAVMTTAGLQTTLNATSSGSQFTLDTSTLGLSSSVVQSVEKQLDPYVRARTGRYVNRPALFSVQQAGFTLKQPDSPKSYNPLKFFALSMNEAASHLNLLAGRLPQANASVIEALITAPTARDLQIKVGATVTVQFPYATRPADIYTYTFATYTLKVRIVGFFKATSVNDYLWHGNTFQPIPGNESSASTFLMPTSSFLTMLDQLSVKLHAKAVFSTSAYELMWDYSLDTSHVVYNQFTDLASRLTTLQNDVRNKYGNIQEATQAAVGSTYPYIISASVYDPIAGSFDMLSVLNRFLNRVDVFRVPAAMLALQVIALILLFISLMADILVERQAGANAVLRSRGASRMQVMACLITQGVGLAIIALVVGPPLALFAVSTVALRLMGPQAQGAITLVLSRPAQALLDVGWYALLTALVILVALSLLFRRAAGMNILSLRRESARGGRGTLWQHLRLDGGAAIIALTASGLSLYLTRLGNQLDLSAKTLLLAPLTIVASIFFIFAIMILFLRFFPLLLRLGAGAVMRGRGAVSMLALAQMARSPRYSARTTLLPAFAIAFVIFALIFNSSQAQRITAIANFEVGTDFSGIIPTDADKLSLQDVMTVYRAIAGVTSVTVGYSARAFTLGSYPVIPMQVLAVDASTFASTSIWSAQDSSQPPTSLMRKLIDGRSRAINTLQVPCIVDAAAVQKLHLSPGATFLTVVNSEAYNPLSCVVVAEVQHIPGINNSASAGNSANDTSPIGVLIDYQTYYSVFSESSAKFGAFGGTTPPFNHVWIRTSDDPAAVAQVRAALQTKRLRLDSLYDRRSLITELNNDPLYRNLTGFLTLGAITTLLLALLGDIVASWLSVRARQAQFVVFRALGAAPRQVVGILTWEQGIVHVTAIILGGLFGALLAITAVPALIFTNIPASGLFANFSNNDFFILQQVVPPAIVIPSSLTLILTGLVLLFALALITMLWVSLRPSLGRALRLNED